VSGVHKRLEQSVRFATRCSAAALGRRA
jgi:sugar/nucleoside kinase (ribokinase family)